MSKATARMTQYLKQYFGRPDQSSSGLDLPKYKNEITILYSGGCRNTIA